MRARSAPWRAVMLLVLLLPAWPLGAAADGASPPGAAAPPPLGRKAVLVLHSFNYNLPSYVAIDASLTKAFVSSGIDFNNLYFEFMDLARNPGPGYRADLAKVYREKFKDRPIDLVVTIHPDALQFLLHDAGDLFPGLPLISVLGTAYPIEHSDASRPLVVMPFSTDIAATVRNIEALQPGTRKLVVVHGASTMDLRLAARVQAELEAAKPACDVEYLAGVPMPELLGRVASLPPRAALLYTSVYSDGTGETFQPVAAARAISAAANAPVFGLHETLLGDDGIVGGTLLDQRAEGERAVGVALEILQGRLPAAPLTILPAPLVPMFDWRQLRRWELDDSALPAGTVYLNRPASFLESHKDVVVGAAALFLLQAALIAALLVQRRSRRAAENLLREKKAELDRFFSMSLDLLCIADAAGRFLRMNPAWEKTLGYRLDELMARPFLAFVHPDDLAATRAAMRALSTRGQISDFTNRYRSRDGGYRQMMWSAAAAGGLVYAAARDVTERLQAEALIQESEMELRSLTGRLILGQEAERRRLARELHDDLSQRLAALAIEAGKTEAAVEDREASVLKPLRELRDQTIRIAADVHDISRRLHPSILDDLGLSKAVEAECARFAAREGVAVDFRAQGVPDRVPPDVALALYRIVQEGLNNVAKHACARRVAVCLRGSAAALHLSVADDGLGFDRADVRGKPGLGLQSIRERVRLVRGRHRIVARPETGTEIEVAVPLATSGGSPVRGPEDRP
jgi:PAS domain S-box-containing protein